MSTPTVNPIDHDLTNLGLTMLLHIPDQPGIDTNKLLHRPDQPEIENDIFLHRCDQPGIDMNEHDTSVIEVNTIWVQYIFIDEVFWPLLN